MKKTFAGGISFKRRDAEYCEMISAEISSITLSAKRDAASEIKEGGRVRKGSVIYSCTEDAPAVFSGRNGVIESVVSEDGETTVRIKADSPEDEEIILDPLDKTLGEYTKEELVSLLLQTGITPMKEGKKPAKFLTVDCGGSPLDSTRPFLCMNYPKQVIGGAKILMKLLGARKCVFAIPTSCLDAAQSIEENLAQRSSIIKITLFKEKYPSIPHLTVRAVTGLEIGAYRCPEDVGYPVVTPHLCYAVYSALADGIPYSSSFVSFTDQNKVTSVAEIPFGAELSAAFEIPEGYKLVRAEKILGEAISEGCKMEPGITALAVVKDTPYPAITERGCIGCRRCVNVCPGRLLPYQLYNAAEKDKLSSSLKNELLSCFGCGCCSALCPSCLPISELLSEKREEYWSYLVNGKPEEQDEEVEDEEVVEEEPVEEEPVEEEPVEEEPVEEEPVEEEPVEEEPVEEEPVEEEPVEEEPVEEEPVEEEYFQEEPFEDNEEEEDEDENGLDGEKEMQIEKITFHFDDEDIEDEIQDISLEISEEVVEEEFVPLTGEITSLNPPSKNTSKKKNKKNKKNKNKNAQKQSVNATEKADLKGIFGESGGENK